MGQELPPDVPAAERSTLIRLVTRPLVAQATVAGAIGLLFGRRHLASIILTLLVVAVLAVAARTGSHLAWVAILTVLIYRAVARAYGSGPRPAEPGLGGPGSADGELGQA